MQTHLILLRFTLLCFADTAFSFINWRFVANLYLEQVHQHCYANSIYLLFVSASHFGNSHNMSNDFMIIVFVTVICNWWSLRLLLLLVQSTTYCTCIRPHTSLINVVCVLTASPTVLLQGFPVPWDTTMLKLGQLITWQWPLSVQVKERVTGLSLEIKS